MKRINVFTFGCAKNLYDSEVLMGKLSQIGYEVVHEKELEEEDIVIVNTCGFINDAKQESVNAIFEFIEKRNRGLIKDIFVFGCLSERYKVELQKEIPEIKNFFGVFSFDEIIKAIEPGLLVPKGYSRKLSTPGHYAYLKISDGCDQKCSFCAIPLIKGKHKSTPIDTLIEEANWLAQKGVKELILVSQDSSAYGLDLYGQRKLVELVSQLAEINEFEWIRLHYLYPSGLPLRLIDLMAANERICQYVDLPVQHISDNVLRAMKRGFTSVKTYRLLEEIKKRAPQAALRTTLLVGHPGESDDDFEELCDFVKEVEFDRLGVFEYSDEEGTAAYRLKNKIDRYQKQERASVIMAIQQSVSLKKNESFVGKNIKVLIDRLENNHYIGRTEFDSPEIDHEVLVKSRKKLLTGEFYQVRITGFSYHDLMAKYPAND
ncbi:MAG TPA: 30S ribosomal protein S12 methylthiotransferase RimO [Bacteroidia bacterium]|nr:30S ribosomal protein S12 methylthiotransferase RimO [Sphingobacteriales bacterium]HPD65964.1 30S ribosomal protein S12 methylthiotransferase RimO [Bacteroidia bacterium]HRS59615.1 30S ribosomal protein S12 methylthiotransferase RimO [Bacteroidia bacterium]HRU68223.1 30S ribosomal protein S12 methylthiotransferase RimO [Bacteroidia bacterium]